MASAKFTCHLLIKAVARTAAGDPVFTVCTAGLVLGEYRRLAAVPAKPANASSRTVRALRVHRILLARAERQLDSAMAFSQDRRMPGSEFATAVRAVDWPALRSTYDSGEVVRDITLRLGSPDEAEQKWAWEQIDETVLQHQGTVYPATAAAAPFLCQLAVDAATAWRAALVEMLAFLSLGDDEPFAPAGTARAVRDAIRSSTGQLLALWGTSDAGLDFALVALSLAFPEQAAAVTPRIQDWFTRSEPPLRTALGLALAVHGATDDAVNQVVSDEVERDARSAAHIHRRRVPGGPHVLALDLGPTIYSPVIGAIELATRLRAGEDADHNALSCVFTLLLNMMDYARNLIDHPR